MTRILDRPDDSGDAVLDGMKRPRQPYPGPAPEMPSQRVASRRVASNRQVLMLSFLMSVVALSGAASVGLMARL